ncbi:MAG: MarR family transcriptional regulator [Clostridiales bacterium]|nr:MarR family transcriptional regulator [Clostridiales bacterium]
MVERATIERFIHSIGNFSRFQDRVPLRMSQGEPCVLNYLYCHDSAQPSQISVAMRVSTARITTILNGLEKRGLVVRQPDETDRRKINVCLTEQGKAHVAQNWEEMMEVLSEILTRLGPEDTAELLRILNRLTEICDQLPT